jgi:hypothetical protein
MPREVDQYDPQLHPSEAFRSKVHSQYATNSYLQNNLHAYYAQLANSPQYSGQYVNGYFQTTSPDRPHFLREHPNWPLPDESIAEPESSRERPLDEWQGTGLHTSAQNPNGWFFRDVQRFRVWNGQDYQESNSSAPNYLSLRNFATVDVLKYLHSDSWQSMDMNRPFYIPEATLKRYNDLVHRHKEAVSVQQFNAREAILAVQERNARPWWKKIFGGGGNRSSSDKRGPLDPRLVVAAAVVLLVIVIVVVVALVKRKNSGHQQFSSRPAQGLWGYDWSASGGRPR